MKACFLLIFLFLSNLLVGQLYFPPVDSDDWETIETQELNWCPERIDSLLNFLDERNTKAFMILKDGKIAIENYFGTFTEDSLWYWASAGKTITALLVGKTLEQGLLILDDPVSDYLGNGWTSCSIAEEESRTIYHQLSMSSSFNNNPFLWDCVEPSCFQCTDLEAGTQWHYHNGVYRRLIEVVEAATGVGRNAYTNDVLESITGMSGFWFDNLYISKHRDMARFGLLALNEFVWDDTAVLTDAEYISALTNPSQEMNPSYGYLWWLNGQASHMLPLNPFSIEGSIVPSGPDDMFMALGANDQKIYVVPSLNLVVTRQGNQANESVFASSSFDEELWVYINQLECEPLSTQVRQEIEVPQISPNPSEGGIQLPAEEGLDYRVHNINGQEVYSEVSSGQFISLPPGIYIISYLSHEQIIFRARHVVY
jgi:CubicO group peptidase (beta-lactamase class C family)